MNPHRIELKHIDSLSADQQMTIAGRIAAITMFSNRSAIWTGVDQGDVPEQDMSFRDLQSRHEIIDNEPLSVDRKAIEETLDTGLFSSRGQNRMGWAHQTYAEFLAAHYLVKHKMKPNQIMSLITYTYPGDAEPKVIPQLHEVAAWLAGMMPEIFREIRQIDPQVLLMSDVTSADATERAALVETLLHLYEERMISDRDLNTRSQYAKLAHPSLAEQLRPYITDPHKGEIVRCVAINMATACELVALQEEISNIALDSSQPSRLRIHATRAIARVGDGPTKARLKSLGYSDVSDDPDDQLKGYALQAIWPSCISAEELFEILTPSKRPSFLGSYWGFIKFHLLQHFPVADLPWALRWVENNQASKESPSVLRDLADDTILKVWEHLEVGPKSGFRPPASP